MIPVNKIKWMGNEHTNSSSRDGHVPFLIVDHISVGSMNSLDSWFTSKGNNRSSAHFGVAKDGRIHQYVAIERMAWANGLDAADIASSDQPAIKDNPGINPNKYSVSIEHEGHDGDLTPTQFESSVWLHQYIQNYIRDKWKMEFPLDRYHIIGHFMVAPESKPYCPGPKFPWERLYAELRREDEEMQKQIDALQKQVEALEAKQSMDVPEWAKEAVAAAVCAGVVDTPDGGSYDFYRLITVLHRKGLL